MVLRVEEPVYKIVTKDERTKEYKLLYDNEDKKKAKEYFESLKSCRRIYRNRIRTGIHTKFP